MNNIPVTYRLSHATRVINQRWVYSNVKGHTFTVRFDKRENTIEFENRLKDFRSQMNKLGWAGGMTH